MNDEFNEFLRSGVGFVALSLVPHNLPIAIDRLCHKDGNHETSRLALMVPDNEVLEIEREWLA